MFNKKSLSIILLSILFFSTSYADGLKISSVDIINDKIIDFSLDKKIDVDTWIVDWEIKVLNNIDISSVAEDPSNLNKVTLFLDRIELEDDTSYSLLTVFWPKWTVDFKSWTKWKIFMLDNFFW